MHNDFDYSYEAVFERGSDGPNDIKAWGTSGGAGYRFSQVASHPRLFGQYDYASGDKNPTDGTHGTFDTMYPTAHDRFGIADQVGWQNIIAWRAGVTVESYRSWTVTTQYLDFWLASATDALYNSSGGVVARDTSGRSGTHVAEEFDSYTWYELNRHVNIGAGFARIHAGEFLAHTTKGAPYNYPYFVVNFKDYGKVEK